ncbi:protein kinase, partial [filamentous cyanobacterium CCP2]
PPTLQRRKFLQTAGLVGTGVAITVLGGRLLESISDSSPPSTPNPGGSLQSFQFETVTVNERGEEIDRSNGQAQFFAEDLGNGITLEMVEIPGGTFTMGSSEDEPGRDGNESPQHQVTVPGFFMGRFQVTQAQYEAITGSNPSRFSGANRPVEQVSWNDAIEFCEKLSQRTGRAYRLPSESEWEYACRAGTTTPFHFWETITTDLANYNGSESVFGGEPIYRSEPRGEYRQQTIDVGSFLPNAFGLHDMHGNVWEWCQDVWHVNYNGAPTDGSAWVTGGGSNRRLLRGGSWVNFPRYCRSAIRDTNFPDYRVNSLGFRVVLSARTS